MIFRIIMISSHIPLDRHLKNDWAHSIFLTLDSKIMVAAPVGPCLKEEPPVDGVYLDVGSAMTAISMCASAWHKGNDGSHGSHVETTAN